ncbi:helix-turn-helix domain-containing protein [Verrucomicrobium spinosum]|nr:helix-turn-helix domain-containing protein [Verrucomicrobium spinosum]
MTAPSLSREALAVLGNYAFPGNVRELKNVIERALILSGGETIRKEHLQLLEPSGDRPAPHRPAVNISTSEGIPFNLEEAEQVLIQRALEQTGGNVAEAARLLDVNRSRIYRRFPHLAKG